MASRTVDERFLLALYEKGQEIGDPFATFHREAIGKHIGLSPKGVKTICVTLCQANFIKKISDDEVALTPHGLKLVLSLLNF